MLFSQSGSLPPPVEAGSRQGNTEHGVPDPFVPMAGAMASGLQSLDIVDLVHGHEEHSQVYERFEVQ